MPTTTQPAVRIALNLQPRSAAKTGYVYLHLANRAFAHNRARMTPGREAILTQGGMAYGHGVIDRLVRRGNVLVIKWRHFSTIHTPYHCTVKNGRHMVDEI